MRQIVQNLICIFVILIFMPAAHAAQADAKLDKAELRLLDGGALPDGQLLSGIEIRLNAGVKTYWRMPGDSGLPPIFDFAASRNVAKVDVKWPEPARLKDADGTILGFEERVIFPLIVTPKDADQPVTLAVTLDFGLCDTLCLPAKADLSRDLTRVGEVSAKAEIANFLARVPRLGAINGQAQPALLSIVPDGKMLVLSFASEARLKDVILEASGSWYFGQPEIAPDGAGRYHARVEIEQKPSSASLSGLALTITALSDQGATETAVTLDAAGSIR